MSEIDTKRRNYEFARSRRLAVVSTVSASGAPEAALVGYAVTPDMELIFETTDATRKHGNLKRDSRIALVIGWEDQQTLQYEGIADEPGGAELEAIKNVYFAAWPENRGHENWPGLSYFRVRPRWVRFSSYFSPRSIEEVSLGLAPDETSVS